MTQLTRSCPLGCGVRMHRFDDNVTALDRDVDAHVVGAHSYPAAPRVYPVRRREPLSFAEIVALVVIASCVGFLAGVGLALVLG